MAVGLVASAVVSAAVALAVSGRGVAGASIAVAIASVAGGPWLIAWWYMTTHPSSTPLFVSDVAEWLPAIGTGLAVAWCGVDSVKRATASVTAMLVLWMAPALMTAVSYTLGSRMFLKNPEELWPVGSQVFRMALGPDGGAPTRMLHALLVIAVGTAILVTWRRRRASGEAPSTAPGAESQQPVEPLA